MRRHASTSLRMSPLVPALLFADARGRVYEHPFLQATLWDGRGIVPAACGDLTALGRDGELMLLPGRLPIGWDAAAGRAAPLESVKLGRKSFVPTAVAAVPAMGYTRTHLPAFHRLPDAPALPLYAYTAAAGLGAGIAAAAVLTDRRTHWDGRFFNNNELERRIRLMRKARPNNRVLEQLGRCATEYGCRTAQNIFFQRWEGAMPVSPLCNARCVGCISNRPPGSSVCAAQHRLKTAPDVGDIEEVALDHMLRAKRAMISFGQGCEGEPTLMAERIEEAMRRVRKRTSRGYFHLNTNGSRPDAIARLAKAGLHSVRIALNSARPELYRAYFRPRDYDFETVIESIRLSVRLGLDTAINLLVFPGVSDSADEAEALCSLIARNRPHALQWRSLCLDPDAYLACLPQSALSGDCLGMRAFMKLLRNRCAWLRTGNFNTLPHA